MLLLLVTVALVGSGAAGVTTMRSYLVGRVDSQLRAVAAQQSARLPIVGSGTAVKPGGEGPATDEPPDDRFRLPSAFVLEVTNSAGDVVYGPTSSLLDEDEILPRLPHLSAAEIRATGPRTFSLSTPDDDGQWRVMAEPVTLADGTPGTLLVTASLADVQQTVERLTLLLAGIGLVAVVLIGAAGYGIVRASLRPLEQVEHTAAAIAAGDLTRRVPTTDRRTEVGQLSAALNTMLTEIETAFAEREASETLARRSEERLRVSEGAARESEERMRRFVADASHELRTPLTSIRGFAELYRQGAASEDGDIRRLMGHIEGEAKRMGMLVDDLLMLARLDQQRPLARRPVDLLAVAADTVQHLRATETRRAIRLEVGATDPPPVVIGDEQRLRQVMVNLLGNAAQHSRAGTPITVRVSSGVSRRTGAPCVTVTVTDEGPGMSEEDAARVFERFYRTDRSRGRDDGGTGLGLSIVAALVAGHGGAVDVVSSPEGGSCFSVELPLAP